MEPFPPTVSLSHQADWMTEIHHLHAAAAPTSDGARMEEEFCPVCGRPEDFCEICGGPHDARRPHRTLPGERVHFTRADLLAVQREAEAWEGSQEFEHDVRGVRTHTAALRALAAKLELLIPPE